jgi:hypothetical protein
LSYLLAWRIFRLGLEKSKNYDVVWVINGSHQLNTTSSMVYEANFSSMKIIQIRYCTGYCQKYGSRLSVGGFFSLPKDYSVTLRILKGLLGKEFCGGQSQKY